MTVYSEISPVREILIREALVSRNFFTSVLSSVTVKIWFPSIAFSSFQIPGIPREKQRTHSSTVRPPRFLFFGFGRSSRRDVCLAADERA